jgi:hypothetical protein
MPSSARIWVVPFKELPTLIGIVFGLPSTESGALSQTAGRKSELAQSLARYFRVAKSRTMPMTNQSNSTEFHGFTFSRFSYVGIVFQSAYDLVLQPYRE